MKTAGVYSFNLFSRISLIIASSISGIAFLWPFIFSANANQIQLVFWIAMPFTLILLLASLSNKSLDSKSIALLGVLAALFAALRPLGAGAIGVEPMWFLLILSSRVFGGSFGFLLGVISMLASAVLTGGIGPWLVYQCFAAGWIALGVTLIPSRLRKRTELFALALYGVFASAIFGVLMDLQFWPWSLGSGSELSYIPGGDVMENINRFFVFHFATSMAWDIPRAILTSVLILTLGPAVLSALRRAYSKASFLAPIEFKSLQTSEHGIARKAQ